MTSNYN